MDRPLSGASSSLGSRSEFNAPVLSLNLVKPTVRPVVGQTTDLGQLGRLTQTIASDVPRQLGRRDHEDSRNFEG